MKLLFVLYLSINIAFAIVVFLVVICYFGKNTPGIEGPFLIG